MKKMIKGAKVMIVPNNKQNTLLFQNAGTCRWAFNWALGREKENYASGDKFISDNDLRKELTQLKKTNEFTWLNTVSNNVPKQAIKDACIAYQRFFKGQAKFPQFKTKKKSPPKFYQDNVKIQFTSTHVKFEGFAKSKKANKQQLNWVRLAEHNRIPFGKDVKYINPRVSFDGLNWWISVGIEYPESVDTPLNKGIGIDLGIKDLAICSDGKTYGNINKTKKMKRLEKQKKRLQRQASRKYEGNKDGLKYIKTKNIIKLEHKIKLVQHKLNGVRDNYIQQTTSEIVRREPSHITIEDLNIQGMMKNKHLSKAIQQQSLYEFGRQLKYKGTWNHIEIRVANRWYPSSKTCHECGNVNKLLNLNDREWVCTECGSVLDRDFNASLNLRDTENYVIYKVG
jgi:putative transposase